MNFLFEVGVEEIPDSMLDAAREYLGEQFREIVKLWNLGSPQLLLDATPRRLVVRAQGLLARQPDSEEYVTGPAVSAPSVAVEGFAKKSGLSVQDLEQRGGKYAFKKLIKGKQAAEVLEEHVPAIFKKFQFTKSMYWTNKSERFVRPVRWVVALLDDQVVPLSIFGITGGNESSGHRKLGAARFPVTYENYEQKLRENFVILSADERRARIQAVPTKYKPDNDLLNTLVNLTEWPTPITGTFDPEFLDLPKEVLMMVMRHHQKYFAVETADGALEPKFVAVTNTDGDPEGLIRHGNERVLRARFNDARFFWNADQKRPLSERVQDLKNVTFQAKLGTYYQKTERMDELVLILLQYAANPGRPVTEADITAAKMRYFLGTDNPEFHAVRASRLSKADLSTELVKEFTELQGIIGGLYARAQGEPEEVAIAIYDHYKPVSMEDSVPRTLAGALLSIADKLDTLRGCFRVGLIPSGSKDPFALRRAAQGIVKILVEGKLRLPIQTLCEGNLQLEDFIAERVKYYFREIRGFRYDEVNAVLVSGWDDLLDAEERLEAVRAVRPTENFEPLAASFKRIRNILRQAGFEGLGDSLQDRLLESGPERELYEPLEVTRLACRVLPDYRSRLEQVASLRLKVDMFFDKILVNAADPAVRQNRLTLLHHLLAEFSTIADFSEIVTNSDIKGNQ